METISQANGDHVVPRASSARRLAPGVSAVALLLLAACGVRDTQQPPQLLPPPSTPTPAHMEEAPQPTDVPPVIIPAPTESLESDVVCFSPEIQISGQSHAVEWFSPGLRGDFTEQTFEDNPTYQVELGIIQYGGTLMQILLGKNGIDIKLYGDPLSYDIRVSDDEFIQVLYVDGLPAVAFASCNWDGDGFADPPEVGMGGVDGALSPPYEPPSNEVQGSWMPMGTPTW